MYWQESFDGAVADMLALVAEHRQELSSGPIQGMPDIEAYRALWSAGWLRLYTARQGTIPRGELMGYNVVIVHRDFESSALKATCSGVFIRRAYRGFGLRFISWVDDQLAREGADTVHRGYRADHDLSAIFDMLGYQPFDVIYAKRLKGVPCLPPSP